jgi:hypothetical protein
MKNENETMEEFNKKFNDLVTSLPTNIKPPDNAILIYYIEAFGGEMRYKETTNLKVAQEMATKIRKEYAIIPTMFLITWHMGAFPTMVRSCNRLLYKEVRSCNRLLIFVPWEVFPMCL